MFKTRAIILRTTKYGETSLVVTAFTELFGIQTYMVNAVRTAKKTGLKASLYLPASLVDMEVYHNEKNTLHRIKECNRAVVYENVLTNIVKNSIAVFMMELLHKLLKQPEPNADLFYFCEDSLIQLDTAPANVASNFPLFFALHLSHFFGFRIDDNYDSNTTYLDLQEGFFVEEIPIHHNFLEAENAAVTAELLKIAMPQELDQIKLNQQKRRFLLHKYMDYYSIHLTEFGVMKTLQVLEEILSLP
jgi:DNA repair protein RecO (recombination protein O)